MTTDTLHSAAKAFERMLVADWRHSGHDPAAVESEHSVDAADLLRDYVAGLAVDEKIFGAASALDQFGNVFEPAERDPDWLIRGKGRQCYANAAAYASVRDDVFYAEGYAIDPALPIPIEHAWLVDRSGQVVDPTWRDGKYVYLGVAFRQEALLRMLAANNGEAGILVNWYRLRDPRAARATRNHFV